MKYYFRAFKKYAVTEGRATRREFVWFYVFHFLISMVFYFLDAYLNFYSPGLPLNFGFFSFIYHLLTLCPSICLQIRRLHDHDISVYWWWGILLPFVGLYVLYLYLKRGNDEDEYGIYDVITPAEETAEPQPVKQEEPCPPVPSVPVPVEVRKPRFCRKCGETLNDGSNFCHKCGTEVVEIPQ